MRKRSVYLIFLLSLLTTLAVLYACATTSSMAQKHPTDGIEIPVICSKCHTDGRASMDHTEDFGVRHRFSAQQNSRACMICHSNAFCSDCHAHKEELQPDDKYKDAPGRMMPHRGDYMNQHKIDGKINPASCFPCHGRQNNERCRVCHR